MCNAGVGGFSSIDWVAAVKQLSKDPVTAVSSPEFYLQNAGERSVDNLGWVWQCNVFGHYVLVCPFPASAPYKADGVISSALWNHYSLRQLILTTPESSGYHLWKPNQTSSI